MMGYSWQLGTKLPPLTLSPMCALVRLKFQSETRYGCCFRVRAGHRRRGCASYLAASSRVLHGPRMVVAWCCRLSQEEVGASHFSAVLVRFGMKVSAKWEAWRTLRSVAVVCLI